MAAAGRAGGAALLGEAFCLRLAGRRALPVLMDGSALLTGQGHMPTPTKAMWLSNSNSQIANSKYHYNVVFNTLPRQECVVVNDWWWSGSCEYADIVYGVDSWMEFKYPDMTASNTNPFVQIFPRTPAKRAFNTAERWQVPALLLSDQHLAESFTNIAAPDPAAEPPDRGRLFTSGFDALADRYAYSEDGVSPRPVPGRSCALAAADSDEHGPEGHITELAGVRIKMTDKRLRLKLAGLAGEVLPPTVVNAGAKTMLCGFGSTLGVMRDACAAVKDAGFVHLPQVWPFPAAGMSAALKGAGRVLTVEGNATGQLARLLRRETGLQADGSVLKYDGRPFTLDEVTAALEGGH